MKLTHVSIDHFGRWQDLDLPLQQDFSLFYGPNEAGKSTLLRFVRGVLFGFPRGTFDAAGELRIEHEGKPYTVRREADGSTRGLLTISSVGQGDKAERWIQNTLGGVGEELFETVFAIGLNELQQLSSLDADEVANSIYGLSLGPEGERVLRAATLLHEGRNRLLDNDGRGQIATLLRRRNELDAEIARLPDAWEQSDRLTGERDDLMRRLSESDRKRDNLRRDLRGMNFMERVYAPWRKQQQLIEERNRLGLDSFPVDAPDRLLTVEQSIAQTEDRRRLLRSEEARLKREYERLTDRPELVENSCRVSMLLDQEPRIRDLRERLKDLDREEEQLKRRKDEQLRNLGATSFDELAPPTLKHRPTTQTTVTRIETPPATPVSILAEADAYRRVGRHYKRRLKRFRSAEASHKRRQSDLTNTIRSTGAKDLREATKIADDQLSRIEKIRLLWYRERLLELQLKSLKNTKPSAGSESSFVGWNRSIEDCYEEGLPQLFGTIMFFYVAFGLAALIAGIYFAATAVWFLGLAYGMLGLATLGTTWILKQFAYGEMPSHGIVSEGGVGPKDAIREVETELRKTRQELDRLDPTADSGLVYRGRATDATPRLREQVDTHVNDARQLVIDLRALELEQDRLKKNREALSRMRTSLRSEKQTLHNAKQAWARALRNCGLRETLKVSDALDAWQNLQTKRYEKQINQLSNQLEDQQNQKPQVVTVENVDFEGRRHLIQSELDRFEDQISDLAIRLNETTQGADAFNWLRRLTEQLATLERQQADRVRIRRERKEIRVKLDDIDNEIARHQARRSDIYAEAGVTTKDEFEARVKAVSRASILANQIDEVRREVDRIAQSEKELAIVEDDLMAFDASQNKRAIEATNRELTELDAEVQTWRERLGRLEAELDELAGERSTARLRFEREQINGRLEELASDYLAAGVAAETLDGVREQVEQNCQPETLQRAERYMTKLTRGKYNRVWTQLGRRELLVSTDDGQDWTVGQLSTGTREQLFLSIRLAMAEEFAEQGGELPLVLDDVLVNFDQHRTEAALDTLIDVAETGQQVLMFSCHLHVASLLDARGREALTLPGGSTTTKLAG